MRCAEYVCILLWFSSTKAYHHYNDRIVLSGVLHPVAVVTTHNVKNKYAFRGENKHEKTIV